MKHPRLAFAALILLIGSVIWLSVRDAAGPRAAGRFEQDVYMWQREWNDAVRSAVSDARGEMPIQRMVVLSRQISWEDAPAGRVLRIAVDWDSVRQSKAQAGAAIRIGKFRGTFDGPAARCVADAVGEVLAEAKAAKIDLAEIQLDFDAAESQLTGYRAWVRAAKGASPDVPVVITALPSWLNASGFGPLAQEAGGYVLQVHGLVKPRSVSDVPVLCDPIAARRAVETAGRIGVPFRVALPTYGYAIAFEPSGEFAAMVAEAAGPGWGAGKQVRLVEADPAQLAGLMRDWTADRPAAMQGVIWYRLPVEGDRLNWPMPTLAAVMNGREPGGTRLRVVVERNAEKLWDITLLNEGEREAEGVANIVVEWPHGTLIAADALNGFQHENASTHTLVLRGRGDWTARLRPGEHRPIGWIRLSEEQEVRAHVEQNPLGTIVAGSPAPGVGSVGD